MDKNEALAHFEENCVRPKLYQKIAQTEAYFGEHLEEMAGEFRESFRQTCLKIHRMQQQGELEKVGFIQYSMLRSSLLEKHHNIRIDAYAKDWYFSPNQAECQESYDAGRIFQFLDELENELEIGRKLYFGKISPMDVEAITLRKAAKFNQFLIQLARYALRRETIPELVRVAKEAEFEVRVGEYYDLSEAVYKEDTRRKDAAEIKEWLEDRHENEYVAAILTGLDLSEGDYPGLDLRQVDFSGSRLTGSNLENALLIKTWFTGCNLNRVNFAGAAIHDADFSKSDLKEATFLAADGLKGMAETLDTEIYSLWGVNFREANLTDADFRYANLQGADFRGAWFQKTDFQGANLKDAVFSKAALPELDLDEEQKASIRWMDEPHQTGGNSDGLLSNHAG